MYRFSGQLNSCDYQIIMLFEILKLNFVKLAKSVHNKIPKVVSLKFVLNDTQFKYGIPLQCVDQLGCITSYKLLNEDDCVCFWLI